ncbi:MAG: acylphosphatase, partial [Candidatus Binatia bacterium]
MERPDDLKILNSHAIKDDLRDPVKTATDRARVHLIIQGKVQGVFFRASTLEQATQLKLKGWVRNCWEGFVEVVAEGPRKDVECLVRWCRRGPA